MSNETSVQDQTNTAAAAPPSAPATTQQKSALGGLSDMFITLIGKEFDVDLAGFKDSNDIGALLDALLGTFFPDSALGGIFGSNGMFAPAIERAEINLTSKEFSGDFLAKMSRTPLVSGDNDGNIAKITQAITASVKKFEADGALDFASPEEKAEIITQLEGKIADIYNKHADDPQLGAKVARAVYDVEHGRRMGIVHDYNEDIKNEAGSTATTDAEPTAPAAAPIVFTTPDLVQDNSLVLGTPVELKQPEFDDDVTSVTAFGFDESGNMIENGDIPVSTLTDGNVQKVSTTEGEPVSLLYTNDSGSYMIGIGSEDAPTIVLNETLVSDLGQPVQAPAPAPNAPAMDMTNAPQYTQPTPNFNPTNSV